MYTLHIVLNKDDIQDLKGCKDLFSTVTNIKHDERIVKQWHLFFSILSHIKDTSDVFFMWKEN